MNKNIKRWRRDTEPMKGLPNNDAHVKAYMNSMRYPCPRLNVYGKPCWGEYSMALKEVCQYCGYPGLKRIKQWDDGDDEE